MEEITTSPTTIPVNISFTSDTIPCAYESRPSSLWSSDVNIVRTLRSTSLASNIGLLLAESEEPPEDEEATEAAFSGGASCKPLGDCDSSSWGFRFIMVDQFQLLAPGFQVPLSPAGGLKFNSTRHQATLSRYTLQWSGVLQNIPPTGVSTLF